MSLLQALRTFVTRCGPSAKFVAKSVVEVALPGSGPVMELIEKLIDCAHETAKANLDALASQEDLQRVEKMFHLLLGDLQGVVEHLRHLEQVPYIAQETLTTALSIKPHCLAAVKALREQGLQLSAMQAELKKLAAGQEELGDVYRRLYGAHLDYIEEQRLHHVSPAELDERLKEQLALLQRIDEGLAAVPRGAAEAGEAIFAGLSARQPESAVLAVAEAASQAAGHNFVASARALARAASLRPGDAKLAELSRVATHLSRGATPVDSRPDRKKRPKPGDTLGGWQLEQLLGFGGWGQVFLARKGDQRRALKIMHAELSQDAEFVKRFKREMGTLIGLGAHPHLVHIDPDHLFDKAEDWNCWYYVMEYVEGTSLERFLEKRGALTLPQLRTVFNGIADGLASAHVRGIIHRDIKPANILLRKKVEAGQGQGILIDFGLGGRVDPHSRGAGYTALFAAPEQMRHGVSDCRSDVYSLAASIYYCLLHNDPDKRGRFKAKLLPAAVPADVRALLERCLDNDPDERPQDAAAFLQEWSHPKAAAVITKRQPGEIVTTSLGVKLAWCPPGAFLMGSPKDEDGQVPYKGADETQHRVTLTAGFWMGIHPITRGQFKRFVEAAGYKTQAEQEGGAYGWTGSKWELDARFNWRNPGFQQEEDHPVVCVSWNDAIAFCDWLTDSEPGQERASLPTEAQWEYACRATTRTVFHYGDSLSSRQANFDGNYPCGGADKGPYLQGTTKVGSYQSNDWGLFDMHGNVWEWCQNWYGPYPESGITDPQGGNTGEARVLRGGSWYVNAARCRAAIRNRSAPGDRSIEVGFRVCFRLD